MSVTYADITCYFSPFSVYCGDKYVTLNVSDFRSTSYDCNSAACLICRLDSRKEESTDASSSFASAPIMVGTPEAWVISSMPKMPFPKEGFGDSEGRGKKTVRWSPYMEELDSLNSSGFELIPAENGSAGKEDGYPSPVRNLVLDGIGSSHVVPAILSYISSNCEKNNGEPWDCDASLYAAIIPGTYGAAMSYALWYKKMNRDCSCQECKRWGKVMERG